VFKLLLLWSLGHRFIEFFGNCLPNVVNGCAPVGRKSRWLLPGEVDADVKATRCGVILHTVSGLDEAAAAKAQAKHLRWGCQ